MRAGALGLGYHPLTKATRCQQVTVPFLGTLFMDLVMLGRPEWLLDASEARPRAVFGNALGVLKPEVWQERIPCLL